MSFWTFREVAGVWCDTEAILVSSSIGGITEDAVVALDTTSHVMLSKLMIGAVDAVVTLMNSLASAVTVFEVTISVLAV